ncbi:hypothetical protein OROMI_020544 [Orobanche minor]
MVPMSFIITIMMCMFCLCPWLTSTSDTPEKSSLETYIVHLEGPDDHSAQFAATQISEDLESWYNSFLPATTSTSDDGDTNRIVHSYRNVFKGFAAKLSPNEVKEMEKKKGFVSARRENILSLHTTHSPNFLGLNQNTGLWRDSNYGKGVIIGVLDTGISPNHPSFNDQGMPPPPTKWTTGKCEFDHGTCNNKIIGARSFVGTNQQNQYNSPFDYDGHGTHTASTVAGNFVEGASIYGNANGTAAGIAPLAHLAIYKVCGPSICLDSDILAAMDAAIEDGVDVLSISLGGLSTNKFYKDSIAIGAFSAMEKGILVSCSAGNQGPHVFSVVNGAPWILTVGASTTNRKLRATAMMGNKDQFDGQSAFQPKDLSDKYLPLVYAGTLNHNGDSYCSSESLNNNGTDIKGKVVVCEFGGGLTRIEKGAAVKHAGGVAMILINNEQYANTTLSEVHVLPATHVGYADGLKIKAYLNSTSSPTTRILFRGTVIGDDHAPVVAAFSSRGPNFASRGILKPDILGPGVDIIAAWPASLENNAKAKSTFNIISGTSMSCPHLSGVAALLKSAHPDWSPAAIKSAIMTTADVVNLARNPIEDERFLPADIFATGSGHVNPRVSNNPGLVYDIQSEDYIPYLCGLKYTGRNVLTISQRNVNCSNVSSIPEAQLNYPSFSLTFSGQLTNNSQTYRRTVTNVGDSKSSYTLAISAPPGVNVIVNPMTLEFSELYQKREYQVTFSRLEPVQKNTAVQGFLKWTSSKHSVKSPIAVMLQ